MGVQGWEEASVLVGLTLLVLGLLFLLAPLVVRFLPGIERVPAFILYVYRGDGFVFATSPLLILVTLIYILWRVLGR